MNLKDLLDSLEKLLLEEQAAVAAFDVVALERITAAKNETGAALRALTVRPQPRPADPAVRAVAVRVSALAEANSALLATTTSTIAEVLGVRVSPGTYDSHARMRPGLCSASARVI